MKPVNFILCDFFSRILRIHSYIRAKQHEGYFIIMKSSKREKNISTVAWTEKWKCKEMWKLKCLNEKSVCVVPNSRPKFLEFFSVLLKWAYIWLKSHKQIRSVLWSTTIPQAIPKVFDTACTTKIVCHFDG